MGERNGDFPKGEENAGVPRGKAAVSSPDVLSEHPGQRCRSRGHMTATRDSATKTFTRKAQQGTAREAVCAHALQEAGADRFVEGAEEGRRQDAPSLPGVLVGSPYTATHASHHWGAVHADRRGNPASWRDVETTCKPTSGGLAFERNRRPRESVHVDTNVCV